MSHLALGEKKVSFILQFCCGAEAADSYQGQAAIQLFCSWSCRHCRKVYYEKMGKKDTFTGGEVIRMKCNVKSSLEECVQDNRDDAALASEAGYFFSCE